MNAQFHGRATNPLIRIRSKPHHIKQSVALTLTITIFSVILFIWVSSKDARSREVEVRAKTVSPAYGVISMFDGAVTNIKKQLSHVVSEIKKRPASTTQEAPESAVDFDLSGVVIIDTATTTAQVVSTSTATTTL